MNTSRAVWLVEAGAILAVVICSFATPWRLFGGAYSAIGYGLMIFGGLVSLWNFYLSWLRYPFHRLGGGRRENFQWVSGAPIIGMLTVPGLVLAPPSLSLSIACVLLLAADTGNIFWFIYAVWNDEGFKRASE